MLMHPAELGMGKYNKPQLKLRCDFKLKDIHVAY